PDLSSDHTQCPQPEQGNDDGQGVPSEPTPDLSPEELTAQTTRKKKLEDIMQYVKRTKLNGYFTLEDDRFLQSIIEKAMKRRQDKSTSLGNPENLPQIIELPMFKPVVYCDDSGSMRAKEAGSDSNRYDRLVSIVQRVARVTTHFLVGRTHVDSQITRHVGSVSEKASLLPNDLKFGSRAGSLPCIELTGDQILLFPFTVGRS
ncbi:uncharacterized protein P174DRAFT_479699, partial [Aspergillus novofumigatus IBT 16806]